MYELRTGLAVLDWNEHVDRPVTSIQNHPIRAVNRRRQAKVRVLTKKTFSFVSDLWVLYQSYITHRDEAEVHIEGLLDAEADPESDADSTGEVE